MKNAWGNGYATEAATAVLDYGFNTISLKRIVGRAHIENAASLSVLHKIGMKYIADEFIDGCEVKTFEAISTR
jgi:RimJ/RimL family protein N-acetyltransferase